MQKNAHYQFLSSFKQLHMIDWKGLLEFNRPFIRWSKVKAVQFRFNLDASKSHIILLTFALLGEIKWVISPHRNN